MTDDPAAELLAAMAALGVHNRDDLDALLLRLALDPPNRKPMWSVREAIEDHVPSAYENTAGYGYVSCSCGWDSDGPKRDWTEHILAALGSQPVSDKRAG